MEHLFVSFFQTHFDTFRQFGYWIIILITYVESIPLLGMLIPGQTIIILSGFMVKLHFFGFWLTVVLATCAATLGDITGFLMGKRYGHHFTQAEKKFYIKKEQIEKTITLISEHPFKTIFFGRLHSLTRTLTPFAAGASNIKMSKFISIDVMSSFVWAFLSILIGFIFGKSFEKASAFIGSFILVATFISVCIILAVQYAKRRNIKIARIDVFIFIVSTVSIYLFALIVQDLHSGRLFNIFDNHVYILRHIITSPILTMIMKFFTNIGGPIILPTIAILYAVYLSYKKQLFNLVMSLGTLVSGFAMIEALKIHYARIRPVGLILESGPSFPSGHTAMSIILAILISYTTLRYIRQNKNVYITLTYCLAITIGFSRIYLGVHWASDVVAGLLFGIFWATFGIVVFKGLRFIIDIGKKKHEIPMP